MFYQCIGLYCYQLQSTEHVIITDNELQLMIDQMAQKCFKVLSRYTQLKLIQCRSEHGIYKYGEFI